MLKLVYCIRRRADVSEADFHRYWLEKHGPLVASFAVSLRARRYVQSHTVLPAMNDMLRASRGLEEAYDGITEVWWDDEASLAASLQDEAGQEAAAALVRDESTFVDFSRSRVFLTEEHEIFRR